MTIQLSDHFTFKKLLKFSFPVMMSMIVSSLFYSLDDGLFVSNFVGKDAFAAINLVIPSYFILTSVGYLFGAGGGALISKILGENKKEEANRVFSMLIEVMIIIGILITIVNYIFLEPMVIFLGADESTLSYCLTYGRIGAFTVPFGILWGAFQSLLVTAERPKYVFWITLSISIINTILDIILVWLLRMGIVGASIATAAGAVAGGLIPLLYFTFSKTCILKFRPTKIELQPVLKSASNGISEMIVNIAGSVVCILYNLQLLKLYGNDGVVCYSIIMYISYTFIGIYYGLSMGTQPLIAYNYGAQNNLELKNIFKKSVQLLTIFGITLTIIAELTAKPLSGIFVSYDQALWDFSIHTIRIYSISYILIQYNIFVSGLFTGLNNGFLASCVSVPRTILFQIPFIYLLPMWFGNDGIWWANLVAEGLALIISIFLIMKYKTKYQYL